jgi:hypothetical protein
VAGRPVVGAPVVGGWRAGWDLGHGPGLVRVRIRLAVNLVNGSTLAGLAVARLGGARIVRCRDGLLTGTGYRLPVPGAPAFTLGNVIVTRRPGLDDGSALFRHEARHATQYAWCGGLLMLPLYFTAAGVSWLLSGDFGAWNVFERDAGLADGGYAVRPPRWARARTVKLPARPLETALLQTSHVHTRPHGPAGPRRGQHPSPQCRPCQPRWPALHAY